MNYKGEIGRDIDADPYKLKERMSHDVPTISEIKASHAAKAVSHQERVVRVFGSLQDLNPVFDRIVAEHNRNELRSALGGAIAVNEGWNFDDGENEGGVPVRPLGNNPQDGGSEKLALPTAA